MIWILIVSWLFSGYFVDKFYLSVYGDWLEYNYFTPEKAFRVACYFIPVVAFISIGMVYGWAPKQRHNIPLTAEERYENFKKAYPSLIKQNYTLEIFLKEYPQ